MSTIKTILLVDDNPDETLFLERLLHNHSQLLMVHAAENGVAALSYLQHRLHSGHLPSLILLDINMPVMNGKHTALKIKENEALSGIAVAIFTSSKEHNDRLFCAREGFDLITKPCTRPQQNQLLKYILQKCT